METGVIVATGAAVLPLGAGKLAYEVGAGA
jgi:hypothetical protein